MRPFSIPSRMLLVAALALPFLHTPSARAEGDELLAPGAEVQKQAGMPQDSKPQRERTSVRPEKSVEQVDQRPDRRADGKLQRERKESHRERALERAIERRREIRERIAERRRERRDEIRRRPDPPRK